MRYKHRKTRIFKPCFCSIKENETSSSQVSIDLFQFCFVCLATSKTNEKRHTINNCLCVYVVFFVNLRTQNKNDHDDDDDGGGDEIIARMK